jgi:thiamine biosynthesis protein ThiI
MDKDEIVRIARDIGTYGPSTAPGSCCTIVPSRPAVAARRSDVEGAEALVDIKALAEAALGGMVEW